ncbi:MAG: PEGA domain-containing protein, partial [Sediminibacterium sp.]|nr:PEGA domain-containing protein [Sediminibacterium sp.]
LEAFLEPVKDINNENCALIKVVLGNIDIKKIGFLTKGGIEVTKVVEKPSIFQIWVYVSYNTLGISVFTQGYGSIPFYEFPNPVKSNKTYLMELRTDVQIETKIKQIEPDFIKINSEPTNADILIDNKPISKKTPLTNHTITIGDHTITLSKPLYYTRSFNVTIKPNENNAFNFKLLPNFGSLQFKMNNEFRDATVFIDDEEKGNVNNIITPIKTGNHTLIVKKELYQDYIENIIINDGETKQMNIALKPNFGTIQINPVPANATLYINKELITNKSQAIKRPAGNYFIELKAAHYTNFSKNISLDVNQQYNEKIELTPKVGNIQITTIPDDADVYINNIKQNRTTPMVVRDLMEGDYQVEIKKQGYNNLKKN